MKVLQSTGYFLPEKAASIYLTENRLQSFAENGIRVVIHASRPTRGLSNEEYNHYKKIRNESMYGGMVDVYRFPMFREGSNVFGRALRYSLNWLFQLCLGLREKNIDCIYLESTPPIQGLLGVLLKKIKKIPFVYCLQDIFPDSLVGTKLAKKGSIVWKIGRLIEDTTYKHADKIIVISEDFKNNIIKKGVPEEKISVIYNWVDQDAVKYVSRNHNKLFDKYNLNRNIFYLEYSGNIGLTQNMDMLLDVMKDLKTSHPDIHLLIVGEGAYKTNVESQIKENKLTNVDLIPFQPYELISEVFSLGDVGLVISKPEVGSNSVPSKTWSIMSASRPVLANFDENELKDIINQNECGIFTKAGDKEAFKEAIIRLYNNRELGETYGKNGRNFILNNLTREIGTQKYVDTIKSIIKA